MARLFDLAFLSTGSGKTNISINLAPRLTEKIKKLNKIFYIFSFNNFADKIKKSIDSIFPYIPKTKVLIISDIQAQFNELKRALGKMDMIIKSLYTTSFLKFCKISLWRKQ